MDYTNLIRTLVESLGMHPDGALIGGIGAVIAVIGKINGYTWKPSIVIILGGFCLSGYGLPALHENWELKEGTEYFLVFVIGFLSNHVYKSLDSIAPKALSFAWSYLKNKLPKK